MIVGLGHQAQVGKDTAANILAKYGFRRLAFADRLKQVAFDSNPPITAIAPGTPVHLRDLVYEIGWERAKSIKAVREYLQNLGLAAREYLGPDVWVQPVLDEAWRASMEGESVVITDVRFPNEFNSIDVVQGLLVKLTRKDAPSVGAHVSETALADAKWHHRIANDGSVEDLEGELVRVLRL